MFKTSFKSSAVFISLVALTSFANAEALPKRSSDFKGNYETAIKDNKADEATALCSATAHDLTKNKKYQYDRFGFTQADYDAALLNHAKDTATKGSTKQTIVKLNGEARKRSNNTGWDKVTVQCKVQKNKIESITVTPAQ